MALSSLSDILLKLSPRFPISLEPPLVYLALKSRFAMRSDSAASSRIGAVSLFEKYQINSMHTATAAHPI
jgi:hypothetical protein